MATRKSSRRRTSKPVALEQPKTDADESEAFWSHEAFMEDEDDFSFDENEHSDKGEVRCAQFRSVRKFTKQILTHTTHRT